MLPLSCYFRMSPLMPIVAPSTSDATMQRPRAADRRENSKSGELRSRKKSMIDGRD